MSPWKARRISYLKFLMRWQAIVFISILARLNPMQALRTWTSKQHMVFTSMSDILLSTANVMFVLQKGQKAGNYCFFLHFYIHIKLDISNFNLFEILPWSEAKRLEGHWRNFRLVLWTPSFRLEHVWLLPYLLVKVQTPLHDITII